MSQRVKRGERSGALLSGVVNNNTNPNCSLIEEEIHRNKLWQDLIPASIYYSMRLTYYEMIL